MSQFWQKRQPRLQPAGPKDRMAVAAARRACRLLLWRVGGAPVRVVGLPGVLDLQLRRADPARRHAAIADAAIGRFALAEIAAQKSAAAGVGVRILAHRPQAAR